MDRSFKYLFSACALSAGTISAIAQLAPPLVFDGKHESPLGKFSHWSAVLQRDPSRTEVEYAVCNFDDRMPLIYKWVGPNIIVGAGGTLPIGKCHIVRRDVAAIDHDRDAFISFTQAGRNHSAPAHLSKLSSSSFARMPSVIRNTLRMIYTPEGTAVHPTLADLVVTQVRTAGILQHTISWHPPTVIVAIGVTVFGQANTNVVRSIAIDRGYTPTTATLDQVLPASSLADIPMERRSQEVILLEKTEKSNPTLELKLEAKEQSISHSYISVIETKSKKLVTDFEITAFSSP
jgi:hypothetical protein